MNEPQSLAKQPQKPSQSFLCPAQSPNAYGQGKEETIFWWSLEPWPGVWEVTETKGQDALLISKGAFPNHMGDKSGSNSKPPDSWGYSFSFLSVFWFVWNGGIQKTHPAMFVYKGQALLGMAAGSRWWLHSQRGAESLQVLLWATIAII